MSSFRYRNQPWKTPYLAVQLSYILLAKIPWWILINLLPSARHSPKWTLKRAVLVRIIGRILLLSHQCVVSISGLGMLIQPCEVLVDWLSVRTIRPSAKERASKVSGFQPYNTSSLEKSRKQQRRMISNLLQFLDIGSTRRDSKVSRQQHLPCQERRSCTVSTEELTYRMSNCLFVATELISDQQFVCSSQRPHCLHR
jgi:hypothetical protein